MGKNCFSNHESTISELFLPSDRIKKVEVSVKNLSAVLFSVALTQVACENFSGCNLAGARSFPLCDKRALKVTKRR